MIEKSDLKITFKTSTSEKLSVALGCDGAVVVVVVPLVGEVVVVLVVAAASEAVVVGIGNIPKEFITLGTV